MTTNDSYITAQLLAVQGQAQLAAALMRSLARASSRIADLLARHSNHS